jgi:hypothetical protein
MTTLKALPVKKNMEIIDERCDCGHLRSQHGDRFAKGHGACTAASGVMEHCPCNQFTWIGFVYASKRRP